LRSLSARAQASASVPLDDIAYTYVDALMARGMFHELSTLERAFMSGHCESPLTRPDAGAGAAVSSYSTRCTGGREVAVRPGDSDTLAAQTFVLAEPAMYTRQPRHPDGERHAERSKQDSPPGAQSGS